MLTGSLLSPDKCSLVGLGSWIEEGNREVISNAAIPGPSRFHSRRGRSSRQRLPNSSSVASTEVNPGTDLRIVELQKTILSMRQHLFTNVTSNTTTNGPFQLAFQHLATNNHFVVPPNYNVTWNTYLVHRDETTVPSGPSMGYARFQRSAQPPRPEPGFDLFCFVSKREYNNARLLLMRNERAIPTLNKIVNCTQYVHKSH